MYPRISIIIGSLFLIVSCSHPVMELTETVHILFPSAQASYEEGSPVSLVADTNVQWYSTIDGYLGEGKTLLVYLTRGYHTIRAQKGAAIGEIPLTITPIRFIPNSWRTVLLRQGQQNLALPLGTYIPFLCGNTAEMAVTITLAPNAKMIRVDTNRDSSEPFRDIAMALPPGITAIQKRLLSRSNSSVLSKNTISPIEPGTIRAFHVADPSKGTNAPGWEITARCAFSSDQFVLWVDTSDALSDEDLHTFFTKITTHVLPRVQKIIGVHLDPDGDGVFNIVMTGKLNQQRLAIGFFNPCDFFPYNNNEQDVAYNPTSNELDSIYCGIIDEQDSAFRIPSLLATIAHEYQHLCRFSRKTYSRLLQGWDNPPIEDTSFDEAASHLMENLVGYGISGGNILFVQKYLQNPDRISLTARDRDGSTDSAGKRGMGALFLFYCLEQQGGFHISGDEIYDDGGFVFFKNSIDYAGTGWNYIQQRFNMDLASILFMFGKSIVSYPFSNKSISIVLDPETGEPITLNPYLGTIAASEPNIPTYTLNGPAKIELSGPFTVLVNSVVFLKDWQLTTQNHITLSQNSKNCTGILGLFMVNN